MLQSRRREHGHSSGELDVFGATSYFAGCLPSPAPAPDDDDCRPSSVTEPSSTDRLYFQAKVVQRDTTRTMTTEDNSFRSPRHQQHLGLLHDHVAERQSTNKQQLQVVVAKRRQPSGKSKLAALLSFMVSPSPSPRASSFRKETKKQEVQSSSTRLPLQAGAAASAEREPADNTCMAANSPSSSSRESSMHLQGLFFGAHDDDDELDLGVATGDRRLQGITVVRGGGADEEKWVVRCVPGGGGAWDDEERREKMMIDGESASSSEQQNNKVELVEVEPLQGDDDDDDDDDDGNVDPTTHSWDSDSSSNLFDLNLEYR